MRRRTLRVLALRLHRRRGFGGRRRRSPPATDIALSVGADQSNARPALMPNGGTATITAKRFSVFLGLSLVSAVPGSAKARVELGGGLQWGADGPDPTEQCTGTPTTGECDSSGLEPIAGGNSSVWFRNVVAPGNGTYTFSGEIFQSAELDPDTSNNVSQITIVVNERGGDGGSAAATASAVKLSPTLPSRFGGRRVGTRHQGGLARPPHRDRVRRVGRSGRAEG